VVATETVAGVGVERVGEARAGVALVGEV